MEDLNNLHNLWKSAKPASLPDVAEMQKNMKQFRSQKLRNKMRSVTVTVLIVILSIVVLITVKSLWFSTQVAIVLNIAACMVLAATNLRSMKRFIGLKDLSNLEFLAFLQQTRRNQLRYYRRTEIIGLTLISASTLLFPYQFTKENMVIATVLYLLAIAWLLILWVYIRPRSFRRQTTKLNAELSRFEEIVQQTV
ncbi:MAG: hypothetical protein WKF66_15555 [Pedobacter sp.]